MKIKIITLVFLGIISPLFIESTSLLEYEEPMALCVGDIIFHTEIDPDLCLYYKGNKLQIDMSYDKKSKRLGQVILQQELVKVVPYTLNDAKAMQEFHMLVCKRPEFASDDNTINYVYVPHAMPYKFYRLTAARKFDDNNQPVGCVWKVTQDSLPADRIVPDNTIIFLFDVNLVEGLQVKSWPLNSNIRLLPSIIIKNMPQEHVSRAIIEARMIAMDFNTVHRCNMANATKIENKTVVTIKP